MSTKYSQSFYFCKYVLDRSVSDEFFSNEIDEFLKQIGPDRPVYLAEHLLCDNFPSGIIDFNYIFGLSFNRLCRKRGYADYFSAEDLERFKNSEGQLTFFFDGEKR